MAATVATPLLHAVGWLAAQTVAALHALASEPFAAFRVSAPPPATVALAASGVALAMPAHPLPGRRLGWLAVLPMFWPAPDAPAPGDARVVVLDVGQGLAVSVCDPRASPPVRRRAHDSARDSTAARISSCPRSRPAGRASLDRLIVSHADNDHAGGAPAVLAAYPRAELLEGPDVTLRGRVCSRGERWEWDGVRFAILHPPLQFAPLGNESSCVLEDRGARRLRADQRRHRGARRGRAARRRPSLRATSSSCRTTAAVRPRRRRSSPRRRPRYALVSAGYANRWGFPKPAVRARWEESGAAVHVTADGGALTVTLDEHGVAVTAERGSIRTTGRRPTRGRK